MKKKNRLKKKHRGFPAERRTGWCAAIPRAEETMTESGIFKVAIQLSPEDRPAYLEQACGDDAALRRDVESLLHEHDCLAGSPAGHPLIRSASGDDQRYLVD
jgi:hypothetical protein